MSCLPRMCLFSSPGLLHTNAFSIAVVIHMYADLQVTFVLGIIVFERFEVGDENVAETVAWTRNVR